MSELNLFIEDAPAVGLPDPQLDRALAAAEITAHHIPFVRHRDTQAPPGLSPDAPVGVMGTLAALRHWTRFGIDGVDTLLPLFSPAFQRVHRYHGKLPSGSRLNEHALMLPFGQLQSLTVSELAQRLTTPDTTLTGLVIKPDQAMKVAEAVLTGPDDHAVRVGDLFSRSGLTGESLMWFGPRRQIVQEYRCLIAQGICLSASTYGFEEVSVNADAHQALRQQVDRWAATMEFDDPAYIMDVAELRDGSLAIIELNALSTSGLYALNRDAVAAAWRLSLELLWQRDYA